jgi:hypothetical protein
MSLVSQRTVDRVAATRNERSMGADALGRLVHVTLALYLIPALLIVLVVGGIGMLVLALGECLRRAAGTNSPAVR